MPKPIIQVENLGKSYALGSKEPKHRTLQEAITGAIRSPGKRLRELRGKAEDAESEFWALRDVSFNIERGEVVGVIGRNGAGKSTLLKILSRITEPTTGRAILRGRVASLLEVGTGFHAELSGRENIYLNGSILGLTKKEIDRKFDEIVDFAEVEKFLDTPVKRYSSGMYVRLAFAVAAHLEPEILIVDEVLAVGDAEFQQKCIGKMRDVSRGEGRTVMFVSHNIGVMQKLCSTAILLSEGAIAMIDTIDKVSNAYFEIAANTSSVNLIHRTDRRGSGRMKVTDLTINSNGSADIRMGSCVTIKTTSTNKLLGSACSFDLHDSVGNHICHFNSRDDAIYDIRDTTSNDFICEIEELTLSAGKYKLDVTLHALGEVHDFVEAASIIEVLPGDLRQRHLPHPYNIGLCALPHRWIS